MGTQSYTIGKAISPRLRELCSKSSSLFYSDFPQKILSLCSLLCSKSTDYSHHSQLYRRIFTTFFSLLQSKTLKMFYSLYVLLSETVTVY